MPTDYKKVIDFMLLSGERLVERTGKIKDIGITKKDLTEEDLFIERGLKDIIKSFGENHFFYAEEENETLQDCENIWVVDPISGTSNFILGLPYFSIAVAHLVNSQVVFGAVYNPSTKELFTAEKGKGAFLNSIPIKVSSGFNRIIFRPSSILKGSFEVERVKKALILDNVEKNTYSMALNYCAVASGKTDALVSLTKDAFPEFAGSIIVSEAGGIFTNINGEILIKSTDRIFVGGNKESYDIIFPKIKRLFS